MAINNRHDFHAFYASRCPNLCATLGLHERRVGEAFFSAHLCLSLSSLPACVVI
jgi:hypothetical protein